MVTAGNPSVATDFIRDIVTADLQAGKNGGRVATRFPPEATFTGAPTRAYTTTSPTPER